MRRLKIIIGLLVFIIGIFFTTDSRSQQFNPHSLSLDNYDYVCVGCHPTDPLDKGVAWALKGGIKSVCIGCHEWLPRSCRRAATPEITKILKKQLPDFNLYLSGESLSCYSCHKLHGENQGAMRKTYFEFLEQAKKINPHLTNIFCILCHDKEPREDQVELNLKFNGDRVKVCIQCHNGKIAPADNHPVNVTPSEKKMVKIPPLFPLSNNLLSCVTCHDIKCQGDEVKIPKFLRGGPYKTRIETCLICHQKDNYQAVNPHEMINEEGKFIKEKCLYCHMIEYIKGN
ncbi:MAG: hypothetical protein ACMUJM_11180 [bacterium]